MKNLYLLFSATILGLATSCSSPLSDTPVSDPGLVTPTIVVEHIEDDYGLSNRVNACLTDKNGAYIELLEGDIKVNGDLMEFGISCYKRSVDVKELKEYNVVVTLADSTEYPFQITTPPYFKKVNYPSKIKKNESFEVSWKSDQTEETKVNFSVQDSASNYIIIFEEYTNSNSITIDPDNFPNGVSTKGKITLSRTTKGSIPEGFNGGSCTARCIFEKTINIK